MKENEDLFFIGFDKKKRSKKIRLNLKESKKDRFYFSKFSKTSETTNCTAFSVYKLIAKNKRLDDKKAKLIGSVMERLRSVDIVYNRWGQKDIKPIFLNLFGIIGCSISNNLIGPYSVQDIYNFIAEEKNGMIVTPNHAFSFKNYRIYNGKKLLNRKYKNLQFYSYDPKKSIINTSVV